MFYQAFVRTYFEKRVPPLLLLYASEYLSEVEFKDMFEKGGGKRTLADVVRATAIRPSVSAPSI